MVLMDLGSNHNIEQINAGAQFLPRCLNLAPLVKKYNKKYLLKWLQPQNLNVCQVKLTKLKMVAFSPCIQNFNIKKILVFKILVVTTKKVQMYKPSCDITTNGCI